MHLLFCRCLALPVVAAVSFLLCGAAAPSPDRSVVADGKAGQVDFSAGVVRATGYGALPANAVTPDQARAAARNTARNNAREALTATVSAIPVSANVPMKNLMQNVRASSKLAALLSAPRVVDEGFQRDGTAYLTLELPLYGPDSIASAVLPEVLPRSPGSAFAGLSRSAPAGAPPPMPPAVSLSLRGGNLGLTPLADPGPFTSVIIDCRGLNVEPLLSPRLYDTTGREVYGTVRVSQDRAVDAGVVGYPRSLPEAIPGARAGARPLIVRAVRVADKNRFHPVISLEDADRILAANNRDRFLERAAVLLLVDPAK